MKSLATPDYWVLSCGHHELRSTCGTGEVTPLDSPCHACRSARVGEEIEFIRFGSIPAAGRSKNHRDGFSEDGVSVYEVKGGKADLVGWHFDFLVRPAFTGTGRIVGWGSDGEPLVEVVKSRKAKKSEVAALVARES